MCRWLHSLQGDSSLPSSSPSLSWLTSMCRREETKWRLHKRRASVSLAGNPPPKRRDYSERLLSSWDGGSGGLGPDGGTSSGVPCGVAEVVVCGSDGFPALFRAPVHFSRGRN